MPPLKSSDIRRHYAAIRNVLERKGTAIGATDMLIAAHSRAVGAVCVTANLAEFRRVPGLKVEDWLTRSSAAHRRRLIRAPEQSAGFPRSQGRW